MRVKMDSVKNLAYSIIDKFLALLPFNWAVTLDAFKKTMIALCSACAPELHANDEHNESDKE